ncbi:Kinesin-4 [Triticum urartu]|uniref:Kinesin-4 n=1 Tax=Triticum urartu TaxID=4572 RepID=M8A8N0_TRIUA|nr:Kinesin-4 [Triticum urartu]
MVYHYRGSDSVFVDSDKNNIVKGQVFLLIKVRRRISKKTYIEGVYHKSIAGFLEEGKRENGRFCYSASALKFCHPDQRLRSDVLPNKRDSLSILVALRVPDPRNPVGNSQISGLTPPEIMPEKRIHNNLHDHTFLPLLPCASFPIAASRPGLWSLPALLQAASDLLCRTPWPWSKAPSDLPNQINDDDERISQPFRPSYMKNLIGEANYEICQERFSTTANDVVFAENLSVVRVAIMSGHLLTGQWSRTHIWLFEHAGNERLPKTELEGERSKEANFIDKSLSALGDAIASLTFKAPTELEEAQPTKNHVR